MFGGEYKFCVLVSFLMAATTLQIRKDLFGHNFMSDRIY